MNKKEHIERHKLLHKNLDELIADYVSMTRKLLSESTIFELMEWSHEQTKNPTTERAPPIITADYGKLEERVMAGVDFGADDKTVVHIMKGKKLIQEMEICGYYNCPEMKKKGTFWCDSCAQDHKEDPDSMK